MGGEGAILCTVVWGGLVIWDFGVLIRCLGILSSPISIKPEGVGSVAKKSI